MRELKSPASKKPARKPVLASTPPLQTNRILQGDCLAELAKLPDASVDVVISNGVLNLVPEKEKAFAEIRRVLRPGGRLQLADIVLDAPLSAEARGDVGLWTD